ncbi:LAFE_0C05160g1_1 [Lachancea fermentati]|uniref:LAFE_0C05160g1_1 n=1 Tax=Lachancea fermentati TaxID=4955 RepID=A0A1G4M9E1_LACFM|nr:LAFE_0C05160g1_1 [Lachancea fermentati]
MRATTRVNVTNKLFITTFLVAFSSVALGSVLPCPAHTLDSDTPLVTEHDERAKKIAAEKSSKR